MKRFIHMLAFVLTFLVGGYAYHTATNISPSDISAYHKLDQETGGFRALPGDVVAVSPDGQRHQRICRTDMAPAELDVVDIDAVYVNGLGQRLPSYVDVWGIATSAFAAPADAAFASVEFDGHLSALAALPTSLSAQCECDMARALLQRERACTVHGALVEQHSGLVRAVQFKTYSNIPGREVYERCNLQYNPSVEQIAKKPCTDANIPWDARWRNRLGLIKSQARDRQEPNGDEPVVRLDAAGS